MRSKQASLESRLCRRPQQGPESEQAWVLCVLETVRRLVSLFPCDHLLRSHDPGNPNPTLAPLLLLVVVILLRVYVHMLAAHCPCVGQSVCTHARSTLHMCRSGCMHACSQHM